MKHWSLRAKLTVWSAVVAGVAVLICGVGTALFLHHEQIEDLDQMIAHEARLFFREYHAHAEHMDWKHSDGIASFFPLADETRYIEIVDQGRHSLFRSSNLKTDSLARFPRGNQTIVVENDPVRLGIFKDGPLTLYLAADLDEIDADTTEVVTALAIGLPSLLALVALGGWWLARTALAPVQEITAAAEKITADRLDRRLPIPVTHGEIGRLAVVLNETFDRLEHSFQQAMRFSADASHELKTPLAVLRASIEDLMESSSLSEHDRNAISELLEQTRRLSSITQGLLLLSRADAGQLRLDPANTDISSLITSCVDDAHIMAESRQITVEAEIPAPWQANVDAARLEQILLNLLDNALKYNRDSGTVRLHADSVGDQIRIRVENTGPGVPPDHSPHLFKRFYRGDEKSDAPGCGLGLSLSRELARAHGGDVTFVKSDEAWTVFELRIRSSAESAVAAPANSAV